MPTCTFCKNAYEFPKGTTVVQKDSSVRYYCSSKCRKNMEMGRLNKKVKWIRKSDVVKAEKAKHEAGKVEVKVEKKKVSKK
jgi:large subunit ribosomal protein L24e